MGRLYDLIGKRHLWFDMGPLSAGLIWLRSLWFDLGLINMVSFGYDPYDLKWNIAGPLCIMTVNFIYTEASVRY